MDMYSMTFIIFSVVGLIITYKIGKEKGEL